MEVHFRIYQDEEDFSLPYLHFKPKRVGNLRSPKVIFFPGVDGFARGFETMAGELMFESFALQYKNSERADSISAIVKSLIPTIEELVSPNEPITMVAYSFGVIIALEVVSILESQNYCCSLVLLDGSPSACKQMFDELNLVSEAFFETYLLTRIMSFYLPAGVITQQQKNLFKCSSWKERLGLASGLIGAHSSYKSATREMIISGIHDRLKAFRRYTPSYTKLKSKITLFKPTETSVSGQEEDYGLSRITDQPVVVHVVDGNHVTILYNLKVATLLNSSICSNDRVASE